MFRNNGNKKCYHCGKLGYFKKYFYDLKRKTKQHQNEDQNVASVGDALDALYVITVSDGEIDHEWLLESGLAKCFWDETLCTTAYLINRSSYSSVNFKTLQELWSGKCSDLSHIRVFGCAAYVHQVEGKIDPKATKCVMLGYSEGVKGYKLWVLGVKGIKIINSRDVKFNELDMPYQKTLDNQVKQSEEEESSTGKKIQTKVKRIDANQEVREYKLIDLQVETEQEEVLDQPELEIPNIVVPNQDNLKILI
ncbi:Reverse transcriptase Ty1/copia-type domain-containing protein [Abeliophyllum distichum]|uniref:Reverse transcriptase Ty1/copia-type domain-containing protein n=1 Tax=Abeliophyllum distichum TaxID=126358 RepID=A0ABD1RS44_9LAMI